MRWDLLLLVAAGGWLTVRLLQLRSGDSGTSEPGFVPPATGGNASAPGPGAKQSYSIFSRFVQIGDRGPDVVTVQEILQALGHSPGGFDGVFGPLTQDAVRSYQRAKSLSADGIVGSNTMGAMAADLKAAGGSLDYPQQA